MTGTKISQYSSNTNPSASFEFLGTDPTNDSQGATGTTETVSLATIISRAGAGVLTGFIAPDVVTLAFASTVAVNAASGNAFNLTLTGNCTLANPANPSDGQVIRFRLTQGGIGSYTVTWSSGYDFGAGSAPTLSTTVAKVDIIAYEYVASISKWTCLGAGLGY